MTVDLWVGVISLIAWGIGAILCLVVLFRQLQELKNYKTVRPYRWTLLIINLGTIFTFILPFLLALVRVFVGEASAFLRISATVSVGVMVLIFSVGMFLMYTVFNKRRP